MICRQNDNSLQNFENQIIYLVLEVLICRYTERILFYWYEKETTYFQDSGISFPYCKKESRIRNYAKYLNVSYVAISMPLYQFGISYLHLFFVRICIKEFNDLISNINGSSENFNNTSPKKFHSNKSHQSNMQTDSLDDMIIIV